MDTISPNQTPEHKARDQIDQQLVQAGWVVQDNRAIDFGAARGIAVREYQTDVGPADYVLFVDKRIVAKIEALFSELDKGIEALKTAREQLKVYRQAVLKHAFEGKLTAQWREENKDAAHGRANVAGGQEPGATKLESPEQLLARIQQEREARYQQHLEEWKSAVKAWEESGKEGKKPAKPLKPKVLPSFSDAEVEQLEVLSNGWKWIRVADIAAVGTGVTPLKSNTSFYVDGDIPWVTSGALNDSFVREPWAM